MYDPAERNRIITEVAERAAAEIRRQAEAEAKRLSEERHRMSEGFLADQRRAIDELDRATMMHFGVVKTTTEKLLVTLRRTIELAREPLPFDLPPAPEDATMEPSTREVQAPEVSASEASAPEPPAAEPLTTETTTLEPSGPGAAALAAQMAAAGSSRDYIIRRLRESFSIPDPSPLADEAITRHGP